MPDEPKIAMIHGLPLTVSPGASDLLAAVHLGFEKALMVFRELTNPVAPPSQAVLPQGDDEELPTTDYLDLAYLNSLSPMARAETLAMYGLRQATPERSPGEPDEAKAEVERLIKDQLSTLGKGPADPEGGEE